jgi:hypothetical protein
MARIKAGEQAAEITMKSKDARMERLRKLFGIKFLHELFPKGCTPNGAEFKHQECSGDVLRDLCQVGQNLANRRKTPRQAKDYLRRAFTSGKVVTHQDVKELLTKLKANPVAALVRATLTFQMDAVKAEAEGLSAPPISDSEDGKSGNGIAGSEAAVAISENEATGDPVLVDESEIANEVEGESVKLDQHEMTNEKASETTDKPSGKADRKRKRADYRIDSSSPFTPNPSTGFATARTLNLAHPTRRIRRAVPAATKRSQSPENRTLGASTLANHNFADLIEENKRLIDQNQRLISTLKSANGFTEQMKEMFENLEGGENGVSTAAISMLLVNQSIEKYGCENDMEGN